MQEMYHSQRSARCHKENMMPVPDDFAVHPEYLCGCKTEDFAAGFRQLHSTVRRIYDDMSQNPADWGLPLFEIEKYLTISRTNRQYGNRLRTQFYHFSHKLLAHPPDQFPGYDASDFSARVGPENCVFFKAFHDRMTQLGYTYQLDVEGIYSDWWKLEYYANNKRSRHFFSYQDGVFLRLKLNHVGTYTGFIETCPDSVRLPFENAPACNHYCREKCAFRLAYSLRGVDHETCLCGVFNFTDLRTEDLDIYSRLLELERPAQGRKRKP